MKVRGTRYIRGMRRDERRDRLVKVHDSQPKQDTVSWCARHCPAALTVFSSESFTHLPVCLSLHTVTQSNLCSQSPANLGINSRVQVGRLVPTTFVLVQTWFQETRPFKQEFLQWIHSVFLHTSHLINMLNMNWKLRANVAFACCRSM